MTVVPITYRDRFLGCIITDASWDKVEDAILEYPDDPKNCLVNLLPGIEKILKERGYKVIAIPEGLEVTYIRD